MVQITNHWHHNHSNSNFINQSFDPNHSPFRISSPSQVIATLQPPRAVVAAGLVGRREFLDPHTLNIDLITLNITYIYMYTYMYIYICILKQWIYTYSYICILYMHTQRYVFRYIFKWIYIYIIIYILYTYRYTRVRSYTQHISRENQSKYVRISSVAARSSPSHCPWDP